MTLDAFLARVAEAIEHDQPLAPGQDLTALPTWDSLAVLNVLDLFEQLGVQADMDRIQAATTTDDLIALAGSAIQ